MQIILRDTANQAERIFYNTPDFPLYLGEQHISVFVNYSALSHWHDDVEFIVVRSGRLHYNINGTVLVLEPGQGLFINSRQLHNGFSPHREDCVFLCVRLAPLLLCASSWVEQTYVTPILENPALPWLRLNPDQPEAQAILEALNGMERCCRDDLQPLQVQSLFFALWQPLFTMAGAARSHGAPHSRHLAVLKEMMRFIADHYADSLTLTDIGRAGGVGKTTCCGLFRRYTGKTPGGYLTDYRLRKGLELLETTDKTVAEICFDTGFSGPSYFAETFRKAFGCSPTAYRARHPARNVP